MAFSSEIEIFKRATHQTPIFCGDFSRSRLKISSEILEVFKRSSEIVFFQDLGPLGSVFSTAGSFGSRGKKKTPPPPQNKKLAGQRGRSCKHRRLPA